MTFQTIKTALEALLVANAATDYQVIGYASQSVADERIAARPIVEVYYDGGQFPKALGTGSGRQMQEAVYRVALTVATGALTNLAVLDNPGSSAGQVAAALAASKTATRAADEAFDALASKLWNLLTLPANKTFGLAEGAFGNLWIDAIKKSPPVERGEWVVLSGNLDISLRCRETPASVAGVPGVDFHVTVRPTADPTADPKTVGTNVLIPIDPKFQTAPEGVEVQ